MRFRSALRGCAALEQTLNGGGNAVLGIKNRRAGHQHVGPSLHHQARGLVVDAAIHFDLAIEAALLDAVADLTNFAERFGDEILAAESWVDRHDQNQLDAPQNFGKRARRS